MNIKAKYYIITIAILIVGGVAKHYWDASRYNKVIDDAKKEFKKQQTTVVKDKDSIITARDLEITNLITKNEKAAADSRYWYQQAKRRSINPDYDLDFITAANILANSKYRPTKKTDSIRQRSDNR